MSGDVESAPLPEVTWHRRASWVYIASMKIDLASQLALIAAGGILLGACGGNEPQANNPAPSTDPSAMGAKASCAAGHTDDKSHCNAMAPDAGK